MKPPRGLSPDEAAVWARLAKTITPLAGRPVPPVKSAQPPAPTPRPMQSAKVARRPASPPAPPPAPAKPNLYARGPATRQGLDSSWERKLAKASIAPDFTLDLHGTTLDGAHRRLDSGLDQARAIGARLVLVVTGKPRPTHAADRGERRGAIRAKILDWLASGPHASQIAAIRTAHPRHGGSGALYVVLRRNV
ncbi:MAG: Smr/MutS family protein [Novosphingobium sp.]